MNDPQALKPSDDGSGIAAIIHLSALFAFLGGWILQILAPLILWLVFRGKSPLVNEHGKAALNFQISMILYEVLFAIAMFVVFAIAIGTGDLDDFGSSMTAEEFEDAFVDLLERIILPLLIAIVVGFAIFIFWLFMVIRAALRAGRGVPADYLLAIPFLR